MGGFCCLLAFSVRTLPSGYQWEGLKHVLYLRLFEDVTASSDEFASRTTADFYYRTDQEANSNSESPDRAAIR